MCYRRFERKMTLAHVFIFHLLIFGDVSVSDRLTMHFLIYARLSLENWSSANCSIQPETNLSEEVINRCCC